MARLALVYGLRLLPCDELDAIGNAEVTLKGGRKVPVTMHLIEGESEEGLKRQLHESLDAFFDFYPEI
jgi:hypothetical protein